jgi:AcrR family transcriptional regulator
VPSARAGVTARDSPAAVALLRSAQTVFGARGYAAAGVEEIARDAGLSKSLIYRHFGSKAKLFGAAVVEPFLSFLDDFAADWEATLRETQPVEVTTERFVSLLYRRMCDARPMLTALLSVTLQGGVPGGDLSAIRAPMERLFDRITEEHNKTAQRYGFSNIDSPLTVRTTFGLVFALVVLDSWLFGSLPQRPDAARVTSQLSEFVVAAVTGRSTTERPDLQSGRMVEDDPGIETSELPPAAENRERRSWGSSPPEMLAAAAELFAEQGYVATSTKEVSQRCGVSESLLFWHFPTKDELFIRAVLGPFMRSLEAFAGRWNASDWPGEDDVEHAALAFIGKTYVWIRAERRLLTAMINADILGSHPGTTFPQIREELRRLFEVVEREHVRVRRHYGEEPLDPALIVRMTFAAVLAVVVFADWLFAGVDPPLDSERLRTELVAYLTAATSRPA